jgi:hypothetical protein
MSILPSKTDAPLLVDADRPPTLTVTLLHFKPIARRLSQIINRFGGFDHEEFAQGRLLDFRSQTLRPLAKPNELRITISETADHEGRITFIVM